MTRIPSTTSIADRNPVSTPSASTTSIADRNFTCYVFSVVTFLEIENVTVLPQAEPFSTIVLRS